MQMTIADECGLPPKLVTVLRTIRCVAPKIAAIAAVERALGGGPTVPSYPAPDYVRRMFDVMPDHSAIAPHLGG